MRKISILIFIFMSCSSLANAERVQVFGGGGSSSVSDTVYGAGWDGDTTVAPSKNAVYDKIETIASGGDNISVNSTGATNANFLDNLYIDWAINTVATPDDITSKFNYAETLAGNPALLTTECIFMADGLMCEGTTADTIEIKLAFPDPVTTDKTITLPNATDTLVGKDTTDTLTNKTMTAAANVIEADTGDSATAFFSSGFIESARGGTGADSSGATGIARIDLGSWAAAELSGDVVTSGSNVTTIADSVTVTGWVLGTSTASSLASPIFVTNNADPADAGIVRLGNAESIAWEAAPAGTDITLSVDASEVMQVSGALNAVGAITGSNLSGTNTGDNTVATSGDSATSFFSSGTLEVAIGGTGTTTSTGTGAVVLGTSPTITTGITIPQGGLSDDSIREADLMVVDVAADEECLTYETTTGDFEWQTCGSGSDTNSVKEYWWPASAMLPLEAADSIPPLAKDAGTNIDMLVRNFDSATDECSTVNFKVPSDVTSGSTITFRAHWYSVEVSGDVILDFRHNGGIAEAADPDAALTTEASAADATQGTAGQITVTTWTETLANLGWAANEDVMGVFCRDANNVSDTLASDLKLIGFAVEIPRS